MEVCDCVKLDVEGRGGYIRNCACNDVHGVDDVVF